MPNTGVLVVLAVIPAVILMIYIYAKDKVEKEPIGMLVGLFFLGALVLVLFFVFILGHFVQSPLPKSVATAHPQRLCAGAVRRSAVSS